MLALWRGVNSVIWKNRIAYGAVWAGKYKIHETSQMKVICKAFLGAWEGLLFLKHTIVRMVVNSPLAIYKAFIKSVGQSETFVWEQAAEIHWCSRKRKCSGAISLCCIMLWPTWKSISCSVTGLQTSQRVKSYALKHTPSPQGISKCWQPSLRGNGNDLRQAMLSIWLAAQRNELSRWPWRFWILSSVFIRSVFFWGGGGGLLFISVCHLILQ